MTNARQTDMMVSIEKGCEEEEYTGEAVRKERTVLRLKDSLEEELWKVALEPDS